MVVDCIYFFHGLDLTTVFLWFVRRVFFRALNTATMVRNACSIDRCMLHLRTCKTYIASKTVKPIARCSPTFLYKSEVPRQDLLLSNLKNWQQLLIISRMWIEDWPAMTSVLSQKVSSNAQLSKETLSITTPTKMLSRVLGPLITEDQHRVMFRDRWEKAPRYLLRETKHSAITVKVFRKRIKAK